MGYSQILFTGWKINHQALEVARIFYNQVFFQGFWQACTLAYLHTCILAYLHTCIPAYLHTCILADLYTCILASLQSCLDLSQAIMHLAISGYQRLSLAIFGYPWLSQTIYIVYQQSGCQKKQERASYCYLKLFPSFFFNCDLHEL